MGEININIDVTDVVRKCMLKMKSTNDSVSVIYHALKSYDINSVPPLETDNLPIKITSEDSSENALTEEVIFNWLFRKTFEDFIVGINESLIAAYKIIKYIELSNRTKIGSVSKEEIMTRLSQIEKRSLEMPIPELIQEIEGGIKLMLPYRDDILSINKVRNCLVHRNGIVNVKDTNNAEKDKLVLSYIELKVSVEINGKLTQLTVENKRNGIRTERTVIEPVRKVVTFSIGENISMTPDVINGVTFACISFSTELLKLLPINGFVPKKLDYTIENGN